MRDGLIEVDGFQPTTKMDALVYFNEVSEDYFATTGTPLVAGRDFDRRDVPGAAKVAVINQTLARRFFGTASPLGKPLFTVEHDRRGDPIQVVGVVKDAKYRRLREETLATVYLAKGQNASPGPFANYALRVAGAGAVVAPLWSVDDEAGSAFMRAFYDALADGASPAHAVAMAQDALARRASTAHPYYWAGFTVFGAAGAW